MAQLPFAVRCAEPKCMRMLSVPFGAHLSEPNSLRRFLGAHGFVLVAVAPHAMVAGRGGGVATLAPFCFNCAIRWSRKAGERS